jgi:hypothetical protein
LAKLYTKNSQMSSEIVLVRRRVAVVAWRGFIGWAHSRYVSGIEEIANPLTVYSRFRSFVGLGLVFNKENGRRREPFPISCAVR